MTLQEIVATTAAETRARRARGAYPADLVRRLAAPLGEPPEQAPEALAFIPSARPLQARGALGPAVVLAQRIARRLLAWYVHPITAEQSRFNEATIGLVRRLERRVERLEAPWRALPFAATGERDLLAARAALLRSLVAASGGPVLLLGDTAGIDDLDGAALVRGEGDPLECLRRMEPASLGGIYLAAVLPRLSARDLLDIVPCAATALAPGGWLTADAPDQAHASDDVRFQRRVPPESLTLLFEAAGLRPGDAPGAGETALASGWFTVSGRRG